MFKTILVPIAGHESDRVALHTARLIARSFGAHIDALHVRLDDLSTAILMPSFGAGDAFFTPEMMAAVDERATATAASARKAFDLFCAETGTVQVDRAAAREAESSAAYCELRGSHIQEISARAMVHDITVFGRAPEFSSLGADSIGSILVRCGRPILLCTETTPKALGQRATIAWKDTAEAAHAVLAAMPLLLRAGKIQIVSAAEGSLDIHSARASAAHLADALRWHGIAAEVDCIEPGNNLPASVVDAARRFESDLLVMGGYGHSRMREFILGGVTQSVLRDAALPILMMH